MYAGRATAEGTRRLAKRFPDTVGFYRTTPRDYWTVSTLGIGTYLGQPDTPTDAAYTVTLIEAVQSGINLLDTAINYRQRRSERNVGLALNGLFQSGPLTRDEVVVCTKAGFLTPGAVPEFLRGDDIVQSIHCMTPDFLRDQIQRSRENLALATIDVFYLHNPETQLAAIGPELFYDRLRAAFTALEELVAAGEIGAYGLATWNGFRAVAEARDRLSLVRCHQIATEVGGADHHFRWIQLPVNLSMGEALATPAEIVDGQPVPTLVAAQRLGLTVVASASLLQSRLANGLPEELLEKWDGPETDAQFAIQYARSTPGVTAALVGMSSLSHLDENLGVQTFAPADEADFQALYANANANG